MIYKEINQEDTVEANPTDITTGLWSEDSGSLTGDIYTYDVQRNLTGQYYLDVYNKTAGSIASEVQFAITYGHINGGGAAMLDDISTAKLPTKAIYSQYRSLLLDPSDTKFTFGQQESNHIYVINIQRARIRGQLDPGNWQLPLSGANGVFTFVDDSGQTLGALTANSKAGRVFNVVSGSLTGTSGSTIHSLGFPSGSATAPTYGLVYPDLGIIVLNPEAICPMVGFFRSGSGTNAVNVTPNSGSALTGSVVAYTGPDIPNSHPYAPLTHSLAPSYWASQKSAYNHYGLYHSLRLALIGAAGTSNENEFVARSAETISSTHYFIRLGNREFNYSNNPTFFNPDNGALIQPDFSNNPKVYATTVGLYNDQNELLAVAKLSAPLRKSFDEEILLRVRLDF